jgi:hypothetical protein
MIIQFHVDDLPPKKDGANSMWRKGSELSRLKVLRVAALQAFGGSATLLQDVALEIRIYADPRSGDLDNFITGICDGLMAAHPNTPIDNNAWLDVPEAVWPMHHIAFSDDVAVGKIAAERFEPASKGPYYEVAIIGHE